MVPYCTRVPENEAPDRETILFYFIFAVRTHGPSSRPSCKSQPSLLSTSLSLSSLLRMRAPFSTSFRPGFVPALSKRIDLLCIGPKG